MDVYKTVNKAVAIWNKRIMDGDISGDLRSALTEECWLVQLQGLDACKSCEYLGTDECGGGFKFLYQVLKHRGYALPFVFLSTPNNTHGDIKTVQENRRLILRALRHFFKEVFSTRHAEETRVASLDFLFPYELVREIGDRIYKGNYHYPRLCTCKTFGKKTVPRDEWYKLGRMTLVYYHQHCIIADDGMFIILDSCGFRTATTKERMNAYMCDKGYNIRVYQHNYKWYIQHNNQTLEFKDGISLVIQ